MIWHNIIITRIKYKIYFGVFQFNLTLAHDGSGKGAALVAAVAKRMMETHTTANIINNNMVDSFSGKQTKKGNSDVEMSLS